MPKTVHSRTASVQPARPMKPEREDLLGTPTEPGNLTLSELNSPNGELLQAWGQERRVSGTKGSRSRVLSDAVTQNLEASLFPANRLPEQESCPASRHYYSTRSRLVKSQQFTAAVGVLGESESQTESCPLTAVPRRCPRSRSARPFSPSHWYPRLPCPPESCTRQ